MKTIRALMGITILVSLLFFLGCREEKFIPDPSDPRLPIYSERGNMVAGALVNNLAWKTYYPLSFDFPVSQPLSFENHMLGDSLVIHLDGRLVDTIYHQAPIGFTFTIRNLNVANTTDLLKLKDKKFATDSRTITSKVEDVYRQLNPNKEVYKNGLGEIHFKAIKEITNITYSRPDGSHYHPMIVAGTFYLDFDGHALKIESGRFDFVVSDRDFN
jgi:hypothetical protein